MYYEGEGYNLPWNKVAKTEGGISVNPVTAEWHPEVMEPIDILFMPSNQQPNLESEGYEREETI